MTRLTKTSEVADTEVFAECKQISSICVDGNRTHIVFDCYYIQSVDQVMKIETEVQICMEIPTLDLVETFNTTWTNHAIGKLKHWINQLAK
tara:strand:- start:1035 stop:1307 length:273 start_codon:yes stop_codon:yes gene_type:complete